MEQFGKYQLIRRIGSGGMAEVFLARTAVAQGLSKQLVIKKIHPAFARSRQFAAMFVDEARIALGLNHPNIVQVFDFGQLGETYFLAMEYVEGLDLLRLMQEVSRRRGAIPFGLCAYVVQQVAKGLDYAHRKTDDFGEPLGIVHRDISPQNILLSYDGAVKIVDFGIARARDVHEEEGVVKGKFAYMAPEQARGELVDRRADVYSAGVVLFELATARPLHPGKGKEVLDAVKSGVIPRPRDVNPEIPEALEEIILKALTFRRDDRYQTGRDLQNALGRFQFEHARATGAPFDSGNLAQYLSHSLRPGARPPQHRPPSSPPVDAASAASSPGDEEAATEMAPPQQPRRRSQRLSAEMETAAEPEARREGRERKHVLVLEGQICGAPALERRLGRRDAVRILQDFFNVARDIAFKHEAYIHRIDESGLTVVVGLPVASEEDPSRTIRLALALIEALDGIGLDVEPELRLAIGIQRGVAIVRRARGARFGYELSAATTGMARRLASESQGGDILCGGAVARVAREEWNFEEVATIDLPAPQPVEDAGDDTAPGGAQRARVYRVRGPKERAQRMRERSRSATGMVGRDLEAKALRDAYRAVLVGGVQRRVFVVGDEGLGKGALIGGFLASIPRGEATVLHAAARAATSYTPLGILADLGRDLLGLAEGAEPREVVRRLEQAIRLLYPTPDEEIEVRALVRAMAPLLGGRAEDTPDMDADERKGRIVQILLRIEERFSSERPLVLVTEDVHWADEQSLELFRELLSVPATRGMLAVFTSRHDRRVLELAQHSRADVIKMEELDEAARQALVMQRFAPDEGVRELARHILSRTGGNPLFIHEMIDSLVDRGILEPEEPGNVKTGLRWVKRDAPLPMPASIESLLVTRIDQLPAAEKETLLCAAVLGRSFTPALIAELRGKSGIDAVVALIERGLLRREGPHVSFRNDLTMGAAYGLLPEEEREALHRAVAAHLATASTYRPGQDDALIARHLELAGEAASAAERYLRAAAHAVEVGGNQDALRQLTRALKLLPTTDHERRFDARCQREVVLRRLARRPAQLREIDAMRKEAEAIGDPRKLALVHSRMAQFYIDVRRLPQAQRAAAPALEYAREAQSPLGEAEALRLRAEIARLSGQNTEALRVADQALALCGDDRDGLAQRAMILNARGTTLWNMGELDEAIDAYAETLVIYRMLKQPRLESRALNNMGVVFSALGEAEEALAHYKSSLKLDQELGDRSQIALKLGNIGQCYADLGDLDRGERYLSKALGISQEAEDGLALIDVTISLGQVYFQRGEIERASELFQRGVSLADEGGDRYQQIRALIYVSLSRLERPGETEAALREATSATELAQKTQVSMGQIYGLAAQGLALAKLGQAVAGAELTSQAVELQGRGGQPEGAEQILLFHAQVCEQAGRLKDAQKALRTAAAEVERRASKLADATLRATYLGSRTAKAITDAARRLGG